MDLAHESEELSRVDGLIALCRNLIADQHKRLGRSGDEETEEKLLSNLMESMVGLSRLRQYIVGEIEDGIARQNGRIRSIGERNDLVRLGPRECANDPDGLFP